jgi:predicted RNA-binding protein with PUA-like domain
MAHWLIKSEPGSYGWDDLVRDGRTWWDGVRNNAARLHMRAMAEGDEAFFYHSGGEKAVVGIARVAGPAAPDGPDDAWVKVPVAPLRPLARPVTLAEIKADPALAAMALVRQPRLSVSPVGAAEWARILELAGSDGAEG